MSSLLDPVQYVKGVGPQRARLLETIGIRTVEDLILYFPKSHYDRRAFRPIRELQPEGEQTLRGKVVDLETSRARTGRPYVSVWVEDDSGTIRVIFWNQPYVADRIAPGQEIVVSGRLELHRSFGRSFTAQAYEVLDDEDRELLRTGRLVPHYVGLGNLGENFFRRWVALALERCADLLTDEIPAELLARRELPGLVEAVRQYHFPSTPERHAAARRRLVYDEFFYFQLGLAALRARRAAHPKAVRMRMSAEIDRRIRARFPFTLTAAQDRAIAEIVADLRSEKPMHRLLQGDVGSGKTAVAAYAALVAIANGAQAAFLAPTEILADQHYLTLKRLLDGSQVRLELLHGGLRKREREAVRAAAASGEANLVVGTHALLEKDVEFQRLGFVVIDEQHRFGVAQRAALVAKGSAPDVLVMTATPIPRTLSLSLYGDLDVSTIDELPPGRHEIATVVRPESKLPEIFEFVRKELKAGRQAYLVYPLKEESDKLQLKAAQTIVEEVRADALAEFSVDLLHGGMRPEEKDAIMERFKSGRTQALVATVVVEVGVDVPNATVMLVEHAERFGLAQLHQLRGRVGRGEHPSYCILVAAAHTEESRRRLRILEATRDGFRIAEEDLAIRGPGEFFGARQHGMPEFRVGDLIEDAATMRLARADAVEWAGRVSNLGQDPRQIVAHRYHERFHYLLGG